MQAEDVKRLRESLACSIGELAATVGVDVKTVLAWESGDLFPTKRHADKLKALAKAGIARTGARCLRSPRARPSPTAANR